MFIKKNVILLEITVKLCAMHETDKELENLIMSGALVKKMTKLDIWNFAENVFTES